MSIPGPVGPSSSAQQGLQGIAVGVPAARRAEQTVTLVRRWGGVPMVGPTLREVPVEDDGPLRTATEEVIASRSQWSIHLTGVGTRRWLEGAEAWGLLDGLLETLRAAGVIARGGKSSAELRKNGLEPMWSPEGETSEEIADWLVPRLGQSEVVALQRAGHPVPELRHVVEGAGARAIEIAPYRWELPEDLGPAQRLVQALCAGKVQALVVTSAPQAHHLFVVARRLGLDHELHRALSQRVFVAAVGLVARRGLQEQRVEADLVAQPPRLGALIRALASAREQILAKAGNPSAVLGDEIRG